VAVFLALAAALTYGTADFCGGMATKRTATSWPVVVVSQLVGLGVVLCLLPFVHGSGPSLHDLSWGAGGGMVGGIALLAFYRALAAGTMSIVAPVTATLSAVVPVVAGLAFLGERPAIAAIAGIAAALAAVALFGVPAKGFTIGNREASLFLAAVAGAGFGLFFICLDRTSGHSGLWPLVAARATSTTVLGLTALAGGHRLAITGTARSLALVAGVFDSLANALFLVATHRGLLTTVSVLTSLYPGSTIVLAYIVLKERLRPPHLVALAVATLAVALIATA
jgi:drug/metabolite transporter (DMT)-like permease